jgi:hypothetical protein
MGFPKSYTKVPKKTNQFDAEDAYTSESTTEVQAVAGAGMSKWLIAAAAFVARMKARGIENFEVRVVDSGNDLTATSSKNESVMASPETLKERLEQYEQFLTR